MKWEQKDVGREKKEKHVYKFHVKYCGEQDADLLKIIVCAR